MFRIEGGKSAPIELIGLCCQILYVTLRNEPANYACRIPLHLNQFAGSIYECSKLESGSRRAHLYLLEFRQANPSSVGPYRRFYTLENPTPN